MSYCNWGNASSVTLAYHDAEWGLPVREDRRQFEYLMMEVMQCGLSWDLMMKKREIFRQCFDRFDFNKIADYGEKDIARILATDGMIRSRRKMEAVIHNARCFKRLREEFGTFSVWIWSFTDGKTVLYDRHGDGLIPASNGLSERVSAELRKRGFKYLGPVTVYSHLQACGIINDHGRDCPRYAVVNAANETIRKRRDHEKVVRDFS
jgi:DNA-3-methyladenine glycosylase I